MSAPVVLSIKTSGFVCRWWSDIGQKDYRQQLHQLF